MEKIVEHFGIGLLAGLGGAGMLAVYMTCVRQGGALYAAVQAFMNSICG